MLKTNTWNLETWCSQNSSRLIRASLSWLGRDYIYKNKPSIEADCLTDLVGFLLNNSLASCRWHFHFFSLLRMEPSL